VSVLFHITDQATWQAAVASGVYRPAWPDAAGRVSCWTAAAVENAANATYAGRENLVLLRIDPAALPTASRLDRDRPQREPVLLAGPLDLDAVVAVEQLSWDGKRFVADDEVAALAMQGGKTLDQAVAQAGSIMAGFDRPWWVAGGWAIDCAVGRRTRPHADLELAVLHRDHQALYAHLAGWELRLARPGGDFARWDGTPLAAPMFHQFWARSGGGQAATPREFVGDPSYVGFLLEASLHGSPARWPNSGYAR
jgi:uncharacterized protein (DUF952 family)